MMNVRTAITTKMAAISIAGFSFMAIPQAQAQTTFEDCWWSCNATYPDDQQARYACKQECVRNDANPPRGGIDYGAMAPPPGPPSTGCNTAATRLCPDKQ